MKICIVTQEFPPYTNWGGIAVYYENISAVYRKMGHHVTVVSRAEHGAPAIEINHFGVLVLRVGRPLRRKYFIGRTLDKILHANDVYLKVAELDTNEPFDIIETTEVGLEGHKLLMHKNFCERVVIQCHGSNANGVVPKSLFSPLHVLDWRWSLKYELDGMKRAKRIIVPTNATRRLLLEQKIDNKKIKLIYHGIDTNQFIPPEKPINGVPLEVGFAGRLEERKGIDFFFKVINKIGPNAGIRFHLKGAIHPSMTVDVNKWIDSNSKFVSYYPAGKPDAMPAYFQSLHVLLQPSRFESFGLVYIEAMASGLIVFAGLSGGGYEIIRDGETGFLVDPDGSIDAVVEKLKVIAANPLAFSQMSKLARLDVLDRFSLGICAQFKLAVYKNEN